MSQQPKEENSKKESQSKPDNFTPEIFLPLGNLRIKTNTSNTQSPGLIKKQESEEDDEVERSYSPSKYFGKRPSFEFKNLKSIEKPLLNRQFSEFKFKEYNKLNLDKKMSKEAESIKVHFKGTEEIIEVIDSMLDSKTLANKKTAKSILKNHHVSLEEPIEKIFDKSINKEIIDNVLEESEKKKKPFKEFLSKHFIEQWKKVENNDSQAINFLKGIFCDNLCLIFNNSIDLNLMKSILDKLRNNYEKNEKMTANFLENFPKIVKFDLVVSCLTNVEKEGSYKRIIISIFLQFFD